jgi:hypothetical protein
MRTLILIAIAGCAFGQQRLNPAGQGNILHPGIPMSGPPRARVRTNSVVPYGGAVYIPYVPFDPFYSGYGSGYGYGAGYCYDPSCGQGYGPNSGYDPSGGYGAPGGQTPTVIINQNFQPDSVHPMVHDYTNTPLPPTGAVPPAPGQTGPPPAVQALGQPPPLRDDQPTIFLIAMKDHTIYPVIAYWVDKDTLNYVTVDTTVKRVPLAQVDRDLSMQLNDQRNVEFKLPASH